MGRISMLKLSISSLLAAALAGAASAQEGARLYVAQTGEVFATYLGNSASYSNDLYLDSPSNGLGLIFNNHASAVGSTKSLGTFTAGTELLFRLHVNDTGYDYFTGEPSRNPDGNAHALVDFNYSPTAAAVHFEDLYNGPFSYNDLSFSFSNVKPTPEPGSIVALSLGAAALLRRRREGGGASWKEAPR